MILQHLTNGSRETVGLRGCAHQEDDSTFNESHYLGVIELHIMVSNNCMCHMSLIDQSHTSLARAI